MITPVILDYIRQNLSAGFSKADIEKALTASGWSAEDIAAGFLAVEHPDTIVPQNQPMPPPSSVDANAAEAARIQAEIALENERRSQHRYGGSISNAASGIIGWLIKRGIVKNVSQANFVLVSIAVIAIALTVWLNWPSGSTPNTITPLGPPNVVTK